MWAIAIFLAVIATAAGYAVWNDRRSVAWQAPRARKEPRIGAAHR